MISKEHIGVHRRISPWFQDILVEQDLIICRVIAEIYSDPEISGRLAMRGGTVLHKVHFPKALRHSVDIDLVQIKSEKIGKDFDLLRQKLDHWMGNPNWTLKENLCILKYNVDSSSSPSKRIKVKIDINTREDFSVLDYVELPFNINNPWFCGSALVKTYQIDEILATKLRALYQRRKSRDLFDIWHALNLDLIDVNVMLRCFDRYNEITKGDLITRKLFEKNLERKIVDPLFRNDIVTLLPDSVGWDINQAMSDVMRLIISKIQN